MSAHDLEPLAPELADLLAAKKAYSEIGDDVQRRVLSRVGATLAGLPPIPSTPHAPNAGAPALSTGAGAALPAAAKIGAAAFLLGAIAGGAIHAAVARPAVLLSPERVAPIVATRIHDAALPAPPASSPLLDLPLASASAIAPKLAPSVAAVALLPPSASANASANASASAEATAPDPELAKERALIQMARTALFEGRSDAALNALQQHAKDFPRGRLGEEREALAVRSLVALGRRDEAKARAERFRRSYPKSLLLPLVDAASPPAAP